MPQTIFNLHRMSWLHTNRFSPRMTSLDVFVVFDRAGCWRNASPLLDSDCHPASATHWATPAPLAGVIFWSVREKANGPAWDKTGGEKKIAASKSFGIMSIVTVNKSSRWQLVGVLDKTIGKCFWGRAWIFVELKAIHFLGWIPPSSLFHPVQAPFSSSCQTTPTTAAIALPPPAPCHVICAPLTTQPRPGGSVPIHLTTPIYLSCLVPHEHSAAVTN